MSTGKQKRTRQNSRKPMGTIEANAMRSTVERRDAMGMVEQHPVSTALVVFGIGMGIGVALGMLLSSQPQPTFGQRAELAAERIGRQTLDAISSVLPNSIARHLAS